MSKRARTSPTSPTSSSSLRPSSTSNTTTTTTTTTTRTPTYPTAASTTGTLAELSAIPGASIFTCDPNALSHRFAFVTAYDGTAFHGWQKQSNAKDTVQAYVEKRLSSLFGRPCTTIVNGRTDGGVHSNGTVFHLDLDKSEIQRVARMYKVPAATTKEDDNDVTPLHRAALALQLTLRRSIRVLQEDIQVLRVYPVSHHFHARMSCVGKRYVYNIHEGYPMPLEVRACWSLHGKRLDVDAMEETAAMLVGVHDFTVFGRTPNFSSGQEPHHLDARSPVRCVHMLHIHRVPLNDPSAADNEFSNTNTNTFGRVRITCEADFFLWNMCRRLVGLLVQVGLHIVTPAQVSKHLGTTFNVLTDNAIKQKFVMTAPAKGLCLDQVFYDSNGAGGFANEPFKV